MVGKDQDDIVFKNEVKNNIDGGPIFNYDKASTEFRTSESNFSKF